MKFWKKKPKRQTTAKPKINTASPKQVPKWEPKSRSTPPPKPKPDKPKKSTITQKEFKRQDARKEFLRVFKQLTSRHRAWIFGEISLLCLPVQSQIRWIKVTMTNRNKTYFLNLPLIQLWLWKKIRSRTFWAVFSWN